MQKIDRRTSDRYMEKGVIQRSEYDSFLKALPDDEANATWVEMDLDAEEMGGDSLNDGETDSSEGEGA